VALGLETNVDRHGYVTFAANLLMELWQREADGGFYVKVKLELKIPYLKKSILKKFQT
jgi:hypothetical protein